MFDWLAGFRRRGLRRRSWAPREAKVAILKGQLPTRMSVAGDLNLADEPSLRALPKQLEARRIDLARCVNLHALPSDLTCEELRLQGSGVQNLPAGLWASSIDAEDCRKLRSVGAYDMEELVLRGCVALESLPEGLRVRRLDLSGCPLWSELPASGVKSVEILDISYCTQVTALPDGFARLQGLNVSGCRNLRELPMGIRIRTWIDVAGSGLSELPWSLRTVRVLWNRVQVPDHVALNPELLTVEEILSEQNQEVRRVMIERVGLDWFFERAEPQVLDEDRDPGGIRRLLRIVLGEQAEIVCVQVQCPSTGGKYLLRVPPETKTCQAAIAWTAGYQDPQAYRPVAET